MTASHQPPPPFPTSAPVAPQGSPDRRASPQAAVNLGSNNPFRTRALSPSNSATQPLARADGPTSTNPFLDESDPLSPQSAPGPAVSSPPEKLSLTDNTRDLFENLSLNPTAQSGGRRPAPPRPDKGPSNGRAIPQRERSERRANHRDPLNVFADPSGKSRTLGDSGRERDRRTHRRNSESSIMERTPKLLDADDDRRRRERRRRERDGRHKDGKSRSKKNHQLDIIDKLDVTSIYGTGMFHHDGPFDACNPNRNRKGLRTAPMQAFPKDSTNMAMGGTGPNKQALDLDLVYGTAEEGYNDFGSTGTVHGRKTEGSNFDPSKRIEPVHGWESAGLGTSTFLEGAPASRAAMRRESENEAQIMQNGGGLQRKKSLAQRIRGVSNNRSTTNRVISPDRLDTARASSSHGRSSRDRALSGPSATNQDHDDAWDKKGASIQEAEEARGNPEVIRVRSSSSPRQSNGFERRPTKERSNSGLEEGKGISNGGGGFISRMKSLRKPRPERKMGDE